MEGSLRMPNFKFFRMYAVRFVFQLRTVTARDRRNFLLAKIILLVHKKSPEMKIICFCFLDTKLVLPSISYVASNKYMEWYDF
jgi:hypothetical protein